MNISLAMPLIALNVALILTRLRAGVAVYVALSLLVPHPSIGGTAVAYEILALPVVLLAVVARRPRLKHPWFHLYLGFFLVVVTLSTILATTKYGSEVDMIRFQGLVRFLLVLGLIREVLNRRDIERVFLAVMAVNSAVGLTQLLVPGLAGTFLRLYGRTGQVPLETYALEDFIPRATGTFTSPVILGSVALFALAAAWGGLLSGTRDRRYGWLLVVAGVAGMASLTKTFFIGAPILLLGGLALSAVLGGRRALRFRPRTALFAGGSAAVAVALSIWLGVRLERQGFHVAYYAAFLTDPRAALATRYGPGGSLSGAVGVILDNPLLGVGMTRARGEFIGDSTYTLLLHSSGIAGGVTALVALVFLLIAIRRRRRPMDMLMVGALLLAGLALPIVLRLPGALALAYLLAPDSSPASAPWRALVSRRAAASPVPARAGRAGANPGPC